MCVRARLYILLRFARICVCVRMFREISSGEPDERNASVSKIEIATTILRVSTIIIDLSL